ncbi:MAG: hypothetical protein SGPRY_011102, partial [Prymnesium sp.]
LRLRLQGRTLCSATPPQVSRTQLLAAGGLAMTAVLAKSLELFTRSGSSVEGSMGTSEKAPLSRADEWNSALPQPRLLVKCVETTAEEKAEALRRKLQLIDEERARYFDSTVEEKAQALSRKLEAADQTRAEYFDSSVEERAEALRRKLQSADDEREKYFESTVEEKAESLRLKLHAADEERTRYFDTTVEAKARALQRKLQ